MAAPYVEPNNQQKLKDIHWISSEEGREYAARHVFSEMTYPNAWGDPFSLLTIINGIERRSAETNTRLAQSEAIQKNLVAALAAVAGGQTFDQDKLLEGVRTAAKEGAAQGAADALANGIELTAKVKDGQ